MTNKCSFLRIQLVRIPKFSKPQIPFLITLVGQFEQLFLLKSVKTAFIEALTTVNLRSTEIVYLAGFHLFALDHCPGDNVGNEDQEPNKANPSKPTTERRVDGIHVLNWNLGDHRPVS